MPNLNLSAETVNVHLTNYASGIYAEGKDSLAEFIAPTVSTGAVSGTYMQFDRGIPFQYVPTRVEDGTPIRKISPNGKQVDFNIKLNALSVDVTDWSVVKAGASSELVTQNKIRTLLSQQAIAREYELTTAVEKATNSDAVTWLGTAGATEDIIGYLDQKIADMCTACGGIHVPNRMTIPFGLWVQIKNHASVRERIAGIKGTTDLKGFASLLANPEMEIKLGTMSYNVAAKGKSTPSMKNMYGNSILLFYNEATPTTDSYGFMKTFMIDGGTGCDIHTFREKFADEHYALWGQDVHEVAKHAGLLIKVS